MMSGTLGNLSDGQQDKLKKLRINVEDVLLDHHDDHMLLRFLRVRNFDLESTESLLRKDIEWKKKIQPSLLSSDNIPEVVKKYFTGGTYGFDKEGSPVWIDPFGKSDMKGLLYSAKTSDIIKHNIIAMERMCKSMEEQTLKLGKHVEGITHIVDLENFGLRHLWRPGVDAYNKNTSIFEQHYPESLKRIIIINAPKIFPLAFTLFKPFLQKNTRKKIEVIGRNWKDALLKYVDADNLPVHWGGTATGPDGDPKCSHQIGMGGKVPESFYIKGRDVSSQDMTSHELSKGSSLDLKYNVTKPGSVFRYEFKTKHHDLAFGIKRIAEDGSEVEIVTKQQYNCHMVPEDGEVSLQEPGTYVVKFDNSHSWTKTKTVMYWVELLEPGGEAEKEPDFMQAVSDDMQDIKLLD